jgi:NADH dehydrogenase
MSNLDGVEISRRGQALLADTLQTKTDERIFALGDCSDLAGADGKPLPSTAQVARQQALFLAKSLASHIKSGEPLGSSNIATWAALWLWGNMPPTVR